MPIAISPSFISNTTANPRFAQAVTNLSDGRFVVSWFSEGIEPGLYDVRARIFSAAGVASAPDFLIKNDVPLVALSLTSLPGGKFAAFWSSSEGLDELDILGRVYNANGTPSGPEIIVNSTLAENQDQPSVTTLADGSFVVIYRSDELAGAGTNLDIRARHFSSSGVALGPDAVVSSTTALDQSFLEVTALTGGGYVVTWATRLPLSDDYEYSARAFSAAGTPTGPEFGLDTTTTDLLAFSFSSITALPDGRFVASWVSLEEGGFSQFVKARILNGNGTPATGDFTVNASSVGEQDIPTVTVLADGRLLFTWQNNNTDSFPGFSTNHARLISDKGVIISEDFVFARYDEAYALGSPAVKALADGRVVVSWHDTFTDLDGNTTPVIETTIFNPLIYTGTASADTWIGGRLKDTISGLGGIDDLSGGAGDDVIDGGLGNDILKGDAGNDRLRGGLGNDSLNGGVGIDTAQFDDHFGSFTGGWDINLLTGKAITKTSFGVLGIQSETDTLTSIESVIGSAGADTIQANQSLVLNNIILPLVRPLMDGGGGNDTLILAPTITSATSVLGKIADDVVIFTGLNKGSVTTATTIKIGIGVAAQIVGATGYLDFKNIETLDTGQGNDRVTGSAFKDSVKLGIGNDTAILGVGDDTAFGGAGLDTLTGGDGKDSLFGEGDVDTISGGNGRDNITGGTGSDKLAGGLNADKFLYVTTADGTDIISDFAVDDFFAFNGPAFGALPVGTLAANRFWTNTTGVAHDADDRFIFNTTNDTLWYDSNGNAAGGAFKMADLNITFNLTAADILIV